MRFSDNPFCALGKERAEVVGESISPDSRKYRSMRNTVRIEPERRGSVGLRNQCSTQSCEAEAPQLGNEQDFDDHFERIRVGMSRGISVVGRRHREVTVGDGIEREFSNVEVLQHLLGEIGSISRQGVGLCGEHIVRARCSGC